MLRLRVSIEATRAGELTETLARTGGVRRLTSAAEEAADGEVVLLADVLPAEADRVVAVIRERGVLDEDYVLVRQEVIAPSTLGRRLSDLGGFAWIEVIGHARAQARPLGRYLALITVAAVVGALGVLKGSSILIVGAMAVSPDLLPICATCVGIAGRRLRLARHAFGTLAIGLVLVVAVAAALTAALDAVGVLGDVVLGAGGLSSLAKTDYSTVIIALAAGVAAMISFETRASAAVGVAISVTTIPASAYLGVAFGLDEAPKAWGALLVLAVNVALLMVSGTLTLVAQRRLWNRAPGADSLRPQAREPS